MATDKKRGRTRNPNNVQHLGLSGMPSQTTALSADADDLRLLNGETMLFHHRHLQEKDRNLAKGCGFCCGRLESVITDLEAPVPQPVVVQSDRTDKTGDTSHPRDGEFPGWPDPGS